MGQCSRKRTSYFFIFVLVFLFGFSCGEKRNLSTPLSRLYGHWREDVPGGTHWYFAPVSNSKRGTLIKLCASKEEINNILKQNMSKLEPKQINEIEDFIQMQAGMTSSLYYQMVKEEPSGEKIILRILEGEGEEEKFEFFIKKDGKTMEKQGGWGIGGRATYTITADGKTIKKERPEILLFIDILDSEFAPIKFKYIDSKTSPED